MWVSGGGALRLRGHQEQRPLSRNVGGLQENSWSSREEVPQVIGRESKQGLAGQCRTWPHTLIKSGAMKGPKQKTGSVGLLC